MEKASITFEVSNTNPGAELGFETWLDRQLMFDTDHVQDVVQISVPIVEDDADHVLKFVLKNKKPQHTRVNAAGEIESDAILKIKNVCFDNISLEQIINEQAVYTHDFNIGHWVCLEKEQFFGTMGYNGTVELNFSTPMYLWLLENM